MQQFSLKRGTRKSSAKWQPFVLASMSYAISTYCREVDQEGQIYGRCGQYVLYMK